LRYGVACLPAGKKKTRLSSALLALLSQDFAGRIVVFDSAASVYCADLMAARRKAGRPLQVQDAMIAACCLVQVATLVTRDTSGFDGLGLTMLNSWQ
jgi:toxin FitB